MPILTDSMQVSSGSELAFEGIFSMNFRSKDHSARRRHRAKRPLGVMQSEPTRHGEPSYFRALVSVGLIDSKTTFDHAWFVWTSVCLDPEVIRLGMKLAAKAEPKYLPSVAAPFGNLTRLLASMSKTQLSELKDRTGFGKEEKCK